MISLKICFIGWLVEAIAIIFAAMAVKFHELGLPSSQYFTAMIMFIVIPFVHLMNDEETKVVIHMNGWIQGVKHMASH